MPAGHAKTSPLPVYHGHRALCAAVLAMYATLAAALALLPAGYFFASVEASATAGKRVRGMLSAEFLDSFPAASLLADVMEAFGVQPERQPWVPSGVDYGNTRIPRTADGEPVCLAWEYRPKSLAEVPEGVNVLSPTWFYVEDNDGVAEVNPLDSLLEAKYSNWQPEQYLKTAHDAGAQVWPAVVCIGEPELAKQIVTDEACRNRFISRIAGWVQQYKLDGINFDFEKMDPADSEAFTALVAQCKQALPPGVVVSVDITVPLANPQDNWWQCYDREGLGRVADYVAVMTYDNPDLEPVAAIGWVVAKTKAMLELVPAEKLLLGVPFYGVDFRFEIPAGEKLVEIPSLGKSKSRRSMTPGGVRSLLEKGYYTSGGNKVEVDYWIVKGEWIEDKAIMQYCFVDRDGMLRLIYCEDEASLLAKGRLAAFERLGGTAVWRMEFGSPPLWEALLEGMWAVR